MPTPWMVYILELYIVCNTTPVQKVSGGSVVSPELKYLEFFKSFFELGRRGTFNYIKKALIISFTQNEQNYIKETRNIKTLKTEQIGAKES